jgi:hypothetical protein
VEAVNWTDASHVTWVLRSFERLVHGFKEQYSSKFLHSLRRDGYVIDDATGHITPIGPRSRSSGERGLHLAPAHAQHTR